MRPSALFILIIMTWALQAESQTFYRSYPNPDEQVLHDLVETPDGKIVMVGEREYSNGKTDGLVVKVDLAGDTVWTRTYGGAEDENFNSITLCDDGSYLVAGRTFSYGVATPGSSNWYLLRLDDTGDTLWTWVGDLVCYDELFHAIQSSDGGYLLAGYRFGGTPPRKGVVFKLDSTRSLVWNYDLPQNLSHGSTGFEVYEEANGDVLAGVYSSSWDMVRLYGNGTLKQYHIHTNGNNHVLDFVPAHGGGYAALTLELFGGTWRSSVVRFDAGLHVVWVQGLDSVFSMFSLDLSDLRKHMSIDLTPEGYVVTRTHFDWLNLYNRVGMAVVDTSGNILSSGFAGNSIGSEIHHGIRLGDGRIAACGFAGVTSPEMLFVMADPIGQVTPVPSTTRLYPSGNQDICQGDSLELSTDSGYYFNYTWWLNNTPLSTNGPVIHATQPGTYRVDVSDGLAMSDSSETMVLSIDSIDIDLGPDPMVADDSLVLDAGPGYAAYLWSNGATTQQVTIHADTMNGHSLVSVDVWSITGCQASDTLLVTWTGYSGLAIGQASDLKVYPNPSDGHFLLSLSSPLRNDALFEIHDMSGMSVMGIMLTAATITHEVDAGDLAPGTYIWRLRGTGLAGRIIITR